MQVLEETLVPNNKKISKFNKRYGEYKKKVIDDAFIYTIVIEILKGNNNNVIKSRTIYECRQRKYWPKMRIAMKAKFESQMNVVYLNL